MSRFSRPPPPVTLHGHIMTETCKAALFFVQAVGKAEIEAEHCKYIWLPLSQINKIIRHAPNTDERDSLEVKEWIWRSKIEDHWNGNSPEKLGSSEVDLEQDLDEAEYPEEGPPF